MTSFPLNTASIAGGSNVQEAIPSAFFSLVSAIPSFGWLLLSATFFGCGEYLSKRWALSPTFWGGAVVVLVDAIGTALWLPALFNRNQLSIVGVAWVLLGAVTTLAIGLLVFKESLTWPQWAGVFCAFFALVLLEK